MAAVEITENAQIRREENGAMGIYSLAEQDKKLAEMKLSDVLVLPPDHKVEKLDFTRAENGESRINIENYGQTVALSGNHLTVLGDATIEVSAAEREKFNTPRLDLILSAKIKGNTLDYGDKHFEARGISGLPGNGRIDFVDEDGKKLLTFKGNETTDIVSERIKAMQTGGANAVEKITENQAGEQNKFLRDMYNHLFPEKAKEAPAPEKQANAKAQTTDFNSLEVPQFQKPVLHSNKNER